MGLLINNEFVQRHPLWSSCPSTLQEISERDYPGKGYFRTMKTVDALDLDSYEHSLGKAFSECTGDATIGIALEKVDERLVSPSLMLVELRMGYDNGLNVSLEDIKRKIEHSKEILNASGTCRIHPDYYFVFTDAEAPRASYKIGREANAAGRMRNYIAVSVSEFQERLIDPDTLPYFPRHPREEIEKSFDSAMKSDSTVDANSFFETFDFWIGKAKEYKCRYKLQEVEHIQEVLNDMLSRLNGIFSLSEDDMFTIDLMREELSVL